jgi:hypothetical protein
LLSPLSDLIVTHLIITGQLRNDLFILHN